jgi:hypothetical protein
VTSSATVARDRATTATSARLAPRTVVDDGIGVLTG